MAGIECGKIDVTKLPEDEIIAIDNVVWMRGDVEEKIYIVNGNIPCVVVKFSTAPETSVCSGEYGLIQSLLFSAGTALNVTDSGVNITVQDGYTQKAKNACIDSQLLETFRDAQNSIDSHSSNSLGYQPAAIMPTAAVIPMVSNIKVYGPYASTNFGLSGGGTQVTVDTDICPWVFGSVAAMNQAANSMVNAGQVGLVRAETGSITIPGLPDLATLGTMVNSAGPNLTNMNFSFGSSGATTSYEFKTFTPKFGDLNKHFIAKFKTIAKNRQEQLKMLRTNQIVQNKINRKINTVKNITKNAARNSTSQNAPAHQNSLQRIIMGEIYDWQGSEGDLSQRTVVGTATLLKAQAEMVYEYGKKAYMSMDGLFGPISLAGDGGLPRFAQYSGYISSYKTHYIPPNPPVLDPVKVVISGIDVDQKYLNPLQNSFEEDEHPQHKGSGDGHVIDIIGRETGVLDSGIITNFYKQKDPDRYSEDYRFLGLRGPLVLHSWGYDLEGKPVPNFADDEQDTKEGTFLKDGLHDYFLDNWLKKPSTWPVAPIDLRFDRERGVWVSPPQHKIVVAELENNLNAFGMATGVIVNKLADKTYGKDIYDKDGNLIESSGNSSVAKIIIEDRIGIDTEAGEKRYAYFDTFSSTYLLMGGGGGGGPQMKLGKYSGSWPKEIGKNIKPVTLYTMSNNDPTQWVPELDQNGDQIVISAINFISYVPVKPNSDRDPWCYVIPFIQQSGFYVYSDYLFGTEVDTQINYSKLYLLLAAEC